VPSTVASVFAAAGLVPVGSVRWREPLPRDKSGIYVVSLTSATDSRRGALADCPTSTAAIRAWLELRPELLLDGRHPTPKQLSVRMAGLWLPDEVVLYIGIASGTLGSRVGGYYSTVLGKRSPHAGGRYLKTLSVLDHLHVHYALHPGPKPVLEDLEAEMLRSFIVGASKPTCAALHDAVHPFPFANSEWKPRNLASGTRTKHLKAHGLRNDIERQR
jgi:hypothetical protein